MTVPTLAGGAAAAKQSQGRDPWDVAGQVTDSISGMGTEITVGLLSLVNGLAVELIYIALAIQLFLVKWGALVIGAIGILLLDSAPGEGGDTLASQATILTGTFSALPHTACRC